MSPEVDAARERLALELRLQREYTLIPDAGQAQFMLDIHVVLAALAARDEASEAMAALDRILSLGHNLDCMFCGWKDREAILALAKAAK